MKRVITLLMAVGLFVGVGASGAMAEEPPAGSGYTFTLENTCDGVIASWTGTDPDPDLSLNVSWDGNGYGNFYSLGQTGGSTGLLPHDTELSFSLWWAGEGDWYYIPSSNAEALNGTYTAPAECSEPTEAQYDFSVSSETCEVVNASFWTDETNAYQATFTLDGTDAVVRSGDGGDGVGADWTDISAGEHTVRLQTVWNGDGFAPIDTSKTVTVEGCVVEPPTPGPDQIVVDGVLYDATKVSGPTVHYETPDISPTSAYTDRHVWNGINGADLLPCEFGIHWIDNANVLTISHCLPGEEPTTTSSTTSTTSTSTTTTTLGTTTSTTDPSTTTSEATTSTTAGTTTSEATTSTTAGTTTTEPPADGGSGQAPVRTLATLGLLGIAVLGGAAAVGARKQ